MLSTVRWFVPLSLLFAAPVMAQTPDTAHIHELHEVDVAPRANNAAEMVAALQQGYPPALRDAGVEGTVRVAFVVRADGQVGDVRVLSASDSAFAQPTAAAVSLLRFSPAEAGGRRVPVRVEQPIAWRVQAPPAATDSVVLPDSIHVHSLDEVDTRPLPRNFADFGAAVRRLYPAELRGTGATATVLARFAIDPSGEPRYAHVLESSDARFDDVTLDAVRRLRFHPAQQGGTAVWVWMDVPVQWADRPAAGLTGASSPDGGGEAGPDSLGAYELPAVTELPRVRTPRAVQNEIARHFPEALRHAGSSGRVVVRFIVEPDGTTSNARIILTSNRLFDIPTLEVARGIRFHPARVNGRPVRVWVELPILWEAQARPPFLSPPPPE